MPQQIQAAEIFIQALRNLLDEERKRETDRLRLQAKAHAERFMKAFRPEFRENEHPSELVRQSTGTT